MKNIFLLLSLCGVFFCTSCGVQRFNRMSVTGRKAISQSLFNDKDRTISEDDIQKLLNGHFTLPDTLRVAVYKFGTTSLTYNRYYSNYADELSVKAQQLFMDTLSTLLQGNSHVKRVNIIPTLMLSAQPTITQLREAAVRLQCDMLLVFAATSDIYYKPKVFKKDETKAYATTEAFVMDIRTGLVPFSTLVTKDVLTQQLPKEEEPEMKRRAQNEAIVKTLSEIGEKVNMFLKKQ